jgi:hypothetical protein
MSAPLTYQWDGEAMRPLPRFAREADKQFVVGETYPLAVEHGRSHATHAHEFAWLSDAWATLPETIAHEYPSAEHLRKRALIATGFCTIRDHVCASRAEAQRLASALRGELDEYVLVIATETVVRVCRAESQSKRTMGAKRFQESKTSILNYVANLLGVGSDSLTKLDAKHTARAA